MNKQISAGEDVEKKGTLTHCWKCIGTGAATVENSMDFLKKLKMELPFDPLLGIYPKNPKLPILKNLCTPMFIQRYL